MDRNIFIFIVCGAKEHIDTLHFSLPYLRKYSKNEIWILTDSTRNETPIQYEGKIIDIKTPKEFDNHQASIYLKTGVYQFVPKGNRYCYLDTDIIAFSEEVDAIFEQYVSPITFAPDHCVLNKFSAYAVNCGCQDRWLKEREKFNDMIAMVQKYGLEWQSDEVKLKRKELELHFAKLNKNLFLKLFTAFRFLISYPIFKLNNEFSFNKRKKAWFDDNGNVLMYHIKLNYRKIKRETGLSYNRLTRRWFNEQGEDIWADSCHHLGEFIHEKFDVKVKDKHFQHWNGGVFLFDDDSHQFLETWFNSTMEIFKDPKWKTRDQGTLIKTVWELGLENHPTLNKRWNLIADYNKPIMEWEGDEVRIDVNEKYSPVLIHVYHHFGDENWSFWNELMQKVNG